MAAKPATNFTGMMGLLQREGKKAGILAVLVIVMGVMWGKALLGKADPAAASGSALHEPGGILPSDNSGSVKQDAAGGAGGTGAALQAWARSPIEPLTRNLFAVKLEFFPQDPAQINQIVRPPPGTGFWDELGKSLAAQADQRKERQMQLEKLQLMAAQLKLQSIMMGAQPKALINGALVREGDVVSDFRILKIEARRIVVEQDGVKLEVGMR
ncbi:MAG TPA: hypothetical protein VIL86_11720 [Tepidisphaeraceae bacterium]|jgi:hypothetical protein